MAFLAGCAAWSIAAWLALVTLLTVLASGAHGVGRAAGRVAELLTPRIARGLLEALLGVALSVAGASPALAAGGSSAVTTGAQPSLAPVPLPVVAAPELPPLLDLDRPDVKPPTPPSRAASPPSPAPTKQPPTAQQPPTKQLAQMYRVRPGDTLWGLAVDRLPAGSSAQQITRDWQAWYLANRRQIGPDPGLVLVGENLVIPPVVPPVIPPVIPPAAS
ncbi:MAG TPA: hypothetical protein VHX15_18525 [Frankiaceae bacterium]|nr:hypothetical protein [Frankiaceae bacterium]